MKDIEKLINCEDIEEIHFIGGIIYKKNPETGSSLPEYLIIDGQQRITTFFVLSLALLELLESKNNSKDNVLIENIRQLLFISKREPRLAMRGENENSLEAIIKHKNLEDNEERVFETYQ